MDDRTPPDVGGPERAGPDDGQPRQPHRPPLSARAAAAELGVNERTVRRWIDQGQLAAVKVRGSYRIRAEEIERARVAILGDAPADVLDVGPAAPPDEPVTAAMPGRARTAADAAAHGGAAPAAVSPAAMAQLEAIRDQWLQPLVDRVGALERENGGLQERLTTTARERDELRAEVERLRAGEDAVVTRSEPAHGADQPEPTFRPSVAAWRERTTRAVDLDRPSGLVPWWRFWERWRS